MFTLSIRITNEEKKMVREYPIYRTDITISIDDPFLKQLVDACAQEFAAEIDDVQLKFIMVWQKDGVLS